VTGMVAADEAVRCQLRGTVEKSKKTQFAKAGGYNHDDDDDDDDDDGDKGILTCSPCRDPRARAFEPEGVEVLAHEDEVEDRLEKKSKN
jgi:hypothetical protein